MRRHKPNNRVYLSQKREMTFPLSGTEQSCDKGDRAGRHPWKAPPGLRPPSARRILHRLQHQVPHR